jgi:hypothetical protein
MATLTKQMKVLVQNTVRDTVVKELARARLGALPFVSVREQREIEKKYGKPSRRAAAIFRVRV